MIKNTFSCYTRQPNNLMIRIVITGAAGRMGKQLIQASAEHKQVILAAALVKENDATVGLDPGLVVHMHPLNISISDNIETIKDNFDILIDFTTPKATLDYLEYCRNQRKAIVIGTTGFTDQEKIVINQASEEIAIIHSVNFSIGINLMLALLKKTAKIIGKDTDIEIIESHHRYKVDAPSGTALAIGEALADTLGFDLKQKALYFRQNVNRKPDNIGFSSIRAGNIIGEHKVLFVNDNEQLTITHKVNNRMTFANGAIRAALWLVQKKKGLFDMSHVLTT